MRELLEATFRWGHVIAGVLWIGLLYFFNWVNGPFAKTLDGETKPKVVPELLPRALYFFRWGAAYTWLTGLLLLGMVYYMGGGLMSEDIANRGLATGACVAAMFIGAVIYDLLWKSPLGKNAMAAVVVSFLLLAAVEAGLAMCAHVSGRALFIHVGALFGTAMAMNVWMRIWPAQRKIIGAIKNGEAPDGALVALAGLRSKHNTYMSVPLLLIMVSNHYPGLYGSDMGWMILLGIVALGWFVTSLIYKKSTSAAPTAF